jgi:DNA-binding transcriptional ArsR family regulator
MDKAASPTDSPELALKRAREAHARDVYFDNLRATKIVKNGGNPPNKNETDRLTISGSAWILNHMVAYRLDATFHALADPTRRGMLANLALGEKSMGQLAEPFAMTLAGAAKHVRVLEGAGLVARRKVGRTQYCTLQAEPLAEAQVWMRQWEKFWTARLDTLETLLANARMLEDGK